MTIEDEKDIGALLKDRKSIEEALREARREVVRRHRQTGQPLVVWRDGRVQVIPPEEIVDEPEAA